MKTLRAIYYTKKRTLLYYKKEEKLRGGQGLWMFLDWYWKVFKTLEKNFFNKFSENVFVNIL